MNSNTNENLKEGFSIIHKPNPTHLVYASDSEKKRLKR